MGEGYLFVLSFIKMTLPFALVSGGVAALTQWAPSGLFLVCVISLGTLPVAYFTFAFGVPITVRSLNNRSGEYKHIGARPVVFAIVCNLAIMILTLAFGYGPMKAEFEFAIEV